MVEYHVLWRLILFSTVAYATFTPCPWRPPWTKRVTVKQRRRTGWTNVARHGCRDRRDRFLNSQKNCHGSHGGIDLLKCAVVERRERNKT